MCAHMELRTACALQNKAQIIRAYLCRSFNEAWLDRWVANGWKTAAGKPVENQDLWQTLINLTSTHIVKFIKVKGHSDNENNNRCDKLARDAIKSLSTK